MRMIEASSTAKNTFNPVRNIVDKIKVDPNPEKKLISLSLGDPTVFGNLNTAREVKDAMRRAVEEGKADGYAPSVGNETARRAIIDRYKQRFNVNYKAEDVFITSGCSGALDLAISVMCGPGDALLIPQPGFTLYGTLAGSKGVRTVNYGLDEKKNWEIKLGEVEELMKEEDGGIKAWIINNPSNPCGSVYSRDHLISCLKRKELKVVILTHFVVAKKYGVVVIADEIYEDMVFEGNEYIPLARLSQESKELAWAILTCSGLAKRFLVPGWRFGWVTVHEPEGFDLAGIRKGLFDLSTLIIGACTLIQSALPEIFANTPQSFYEDTNRVLEANAQFLSESLSEIEGLKVIKPQGTMYMLVGIDFEKFAGFEDDLKVSELLISEQSISVLPGSVQKTEKRILCYSNPNLLDIWYKRVL